MAKKKKSKVNQEKDNAYWDELYGRQSAIEQLATLQLKGQHSKKLQTKLDEMLCDFLLNDPEE